MIVRFYGGPKHAEVVEVPDGALYLNVAGGSLWGSEPLKVGLYKSEPHAPLTNEDGEAIFRWQGWETPPTGP